MGESRILSHQFLKQKLALSLSFQHILKVSSDPGAAHPGSEGMCALSNEALMAFSTTKSRLTEIIFTQLINVALKLTKHNARQEFQ